MAWTVVETPNAKYVLVFVGDHKKPVKPIPSKFDALVLETGLIMPQDIFRHNPYKEIVTSALTSFSH